MIKKRTVLILGAGASKPYGFPIGRILTDSIIENSPTPITEYNQSPNSIQEILIFLKLNHLLGQFTNDLDRSQLNSVDSFLEKRTEYIELGKVLIANQLLPIEKNHASRTRHSDKDAWFRHVWNKWHTSNAENLLNGKLSFVTFNYDRSLEFILHQAIQSIYGIGSAEAGRMILSNINIKHVYGSLGSMFATSEKKLVVAYGAEHADLQVLKSVIESIKIIHEVKDINEADAIHQLLDEAEDICFLGFGYLRENLDRVIGEVDLSGKNVYGSSYELTKSEETGIDQYFKKFYKKLNPNTRISFHNGTSLQTLRYFDLLKTQ